MCGFAGFIDFSKKSTEKDLVAMCDVIQHRGPDAGSYFLKEKDNYNIGLGHRRLSIIDLHECSNQPMFYKDLVIIFNGEIYNYQEIKKDLIQLGHSFETNSDTEVILHAFEEWGDECVQRFIGMFAFIIYNQKTQIVKTFRDRPGVKPLHIYQKDNIIMWASEIKSFHEHPAFEKKLRLDAVKSFIQLGYVPSPFSIFENVTKQDSGSIITFDLNSQKQNQEKYWSVIDFYKKSILDIDYNEAKTKTKELLTSACQYRMVADVPVGVFLSGGYDSVLVTSILQHNTSDKIKTFTIGVNDEKLNEAKFAKEIAERLETEHTEYYISENEMFNLIEKHAFHYDEPFGDSSAIPTMLVSQIAKQDVTVALSADGGDEVFAGYNRYDQLSILKKIKLLSQLPKMDSLAKLFIKDPFKQHRIKSLIQNPTAITLAQQLNNPYYPDEINQLFINPIQNLAIDIGKYSEINDDLRAIMAFDYDTYLLNDIMVKVDRATMFSSLEGREPLLDHRLIEYVAQLPNDFKINNGVKKYMLRDIVHDYIPKEMMERPKMGFAAPLEQWLKVDLKDKLEYYFSQNFIKEQNIFDFNNLNKIKVDYLSGKNQYALKLWYILVFQMWYEKWMIN